MSGNIIIKRKIVQSVEKPTSGDIVIQHPIVRLKPIVFQTVKGNKIDKIAGQRRHRKKNLLVALKEMRVKPKYTQLKNKLRGASVCFETAAKSLKSIEWQKKRNEMIAAVILNKETKGPVHSSDITGEHIYPRYLDVPAAKAKILGYPMEGLMLIEPLWTQEQKDTLVNWLETNNKDLPARKPVMGTLEPRDTNTYTVVGGPTLFRYSNQYFPTRSIPPELEWVLNWANKTFQLNTNTLHTNIYQKPADSVMMHSDHDGWNRFILSLIICKPGAERTMTVQDYHTGEVVRILQPTFSFLAMSPGQNLAAMHGILNKKEPMTGARYNLTLREHFLIPGLDAKASAAQDKKDYELALDRVDEGLLLYQEYLEAQENN